MLILILKLPTEAAFPYPDQGIHNYLIEPPGSSQTDIEIRYMNFLSAIFQVTADELEFQEANIVMKYNDRRQGLAGWWLDHMRTQKRQIYKKIIEVATVRMQ